MSKRLEQFRMARKSATSAFTQVIQLNKKYNNPLFCCFEGEDFKYYGIRIEQTTNKFFDKIIPIQCGGKKEVIRLYSLIFKEETITTNNTLYFVDLDFDTSIKESNNNIYETPYYSIENFYTTQCAFEKILSSELKLEEINPEYQYSIKKYIDRQKEFHNGILYLNAWIYCQRKANTNKLYLNEFKLNKILKEISIDKVSFIEYDKNFLKSCLPNAIDIEDSKIEDAKSILATNPQKNFRGKFEIEFLYEFLTILIKRINKKKEPFVKCKKVGISLSKTNLLSELSQYAHTPPCLNEYIKKSA